MGDNTIFENQAEIPIENLRSAIYTDREIFLQMIYSLIEQMPMSLLKKIFSCEKTDPFNKETEDLLWNNRTPNYVKERIMLLKDKKVILYKVILDSKFLTKKDRNND